MTEPTDTSSRKQRLQLTLAALAAALAIGGVAAVALSGDGESEPLGEDAGGETDASDEADRRKVLESRNPVREAREAGIPILKVTPKQARQAFDNPRRLRKLLEKQQSK